MQRNGRRNYEINGVSVSTTWTPSVGYKVDILNNGGDDKSKRGDPMELRHASVSWNSGGESDHIGSEGESADDDGGDDWHGSSKLKNSSREAEYESSSN